MKPQVAQQPGKQQRKARQAAVEPDHYAADEQRAQVDVRHTARQIGAEGRKGQQLQYQWSKQEVEKAQTDVCEVGQPTATRQRECDRCQKDEQDNHA
ncbi:MAG: hypothetical protein E6J26_04210 [Chloroflexi bacterium]|nr:MAG: hypothetical protein E6J26_04210 [Chloroflexota bacterium]